MMAGLIPRPDTIPVPWGWFEFLLMLTFPLHLLFMNCMLGTAAIALYARVRGGEVRFRLGRELGRTLLFLIAFTVTFGVAPLLFVQVLYGHFFYVSSILMAAFWLAVVPMLIIAYYAAYVHDSRSDSSGFLGTAGIGLSFGLFLVIAFLYTNNMTLMLDPGKWSAYFDNPAGTRLNLGDPALLPRYLHFLVGGTAIGGLFVAVLGKWKERRDPELSQAAVSLGMDVFSWLTLAQLAAGVWFLVSLPRDVMLAFLGGDKAATLTLLAGVALALAALAAGFRKKVGAAVVLAVPLVYVMAFVRNFVRAGYLGPYFRPSELVVVPQYSPMVLFAVTLVAGVAAVAWLLLRAKSAAGIPAEKA